MVACDAAAVPNAAFVIVIISSATVNEVMALVVKAVAVFTVVAAPVAVVAVAVVV